MADLVKQALEELEVEAAAPQQGPQTTPGFGLHVDPAAILAGLAGFAVGRATAPQPLPPSPPQLGLSGDYYSQVNNLANNLQVVFTPVSVLYRIGGTTIDVIETDQMTPAMQKAYLDRNQAFFKDLMLNKVHMQAQLAQQAFADQLIDAHQGMRQALIAPGGGMEKASADDAPRTPFDRVAALADVTATLQRAAASPTTALYMRQVEELLERTAGVLPLEPGGLDKLGELSGLKWLHWLVPGASQAVAQAELGHPDLVAARVRIAFLPDRVLYVVGDTVIGQTTTLQMNAEGYQHFHEHDARYFRAFLLQSMRSGPGFPEAGPAPEIDKQAASNRNLAFTEPDTDPRVLMTLLDQQFGADTWTLWDPAALVNNVELAWRTGALPAVIFDKLAMLQLCKVSPAVYQDPHVFEKCVIAFSGRVPDFLDRQFYSAGDLAFTLHVMAAAAPAGIDPYGELTDPVMRAIADMLFAARGLFLRPEKLDRGAADFYAGINGLLAELWEPTLGTDAERAQDFAGAAIGAFRHRGITPARPLVEKLLGQVGAPVDLWPQISMAVLENLGVDAFLRQLAQRYQAQMARFLAGNG